ncbi:hypothetical protein IEI94_09250 [Halomonas sp. ML-15]|uniref:DUF6586 family protein n=1 Tax=Halomonas sp. ML-15 TaxID=2773305 RepID=UPI001745D70C|nr:DUF6586 family protein [Halomonas sp. ML-15]MBD3896036.1 hypothetical protein [Halomonas sp. ML-15]
MTPRGRTNQLLYQAELLLAQAPGDDEHAAARRMALEEGALALLELGLNAALRELTEHAMLPRHDWRELLAEERPPLAALEQLSELARREGSWLDVLLTRIEALHDVEGAARRQPSRSGLIISAAEQSLGDELGEALAGLKATLATLRETSEEW